ncbi:MAG: hypothetical protein IBX56_02705 [Methylomicrobium sp.]|nr:hypothetical protein [Methylomicrobium sp.]
MTRYKLRFFAMVEADDGEWVRLSESHCERDCVCTDYINSLDRLKTKHTMELSVYKYNIRHLANIVGRKNEEIVNLEVELAYTRDKLAKLMDSK